MRTNILLVNENDTPSGLCEKLKVHRLGLLHRAFSVFIINDKNELLIQQRALSKNHSGGLWSNTCCGHFTSTNNCEAQAEQRLFEEMGIHCSLAYLFSYRYKVNFENKLTENELVYAYVGVFQEDPVPNSEEVCNWKWMNIEQLKNEMLNCRHLFTYWFALFYNDFIEHLKTRDEKKKP